MLSGYNGVKRLAKEHPDWLPIVVASFECAKGFREFAGRWVLDELNKAGWPGLRFGNMRAKWFPGLRLLVGYGILKHEDTVRGGRRAYYTMPDPEGVKKALSELGLLNKASGRDFQTNEKVVDTNIPEELKHIPDRPYPQGLLRVMYQDVRMHNLSKKVDKKQSAKEVLDECITHLRKDHPSFEFRYDKEFFK